MLTQHGGYIEQIWRTRRRGVGHFGIKIVTIRRTMTNLRQFEYLGPATWRTIFQKMRNFQSSTV